MFQLAVVPLSTYPTIKLFSLPPSEVGKRFRLWSMCQGAGLSRQSTEIRQKTRMGCCKGSTCKFPSFFLQFDCICKLKEEGCGLPQNCSGLSSFAGGAGWGMSAGGGQAECESAVCPCSSKVKPRTALAREWPAGQGSDPSLCVAGMRHLEHRVQVWGLRLLRLERIQRRTTKGVTDLGHKKCEYRAKGQGLC